jgi:hypothetical protein
MLITEPHSTPRASSFGLSTSLTLDVDCMRSAIGDIRANVFEVTGTDRGVPQQTDSANCWTYTASIWGIMCEINSLALAWVTEAIALLFAGGELGSAVRS